MFIIKKDGTLQKFDRNKIINAINLSSERVNEKIPDIVLEQICNNIESECLKEQNNVPVAKVHFLVESNLEKTNADIAKSYKDYRNYKKDFVHMFDEVYKQSQKIMYIGDKENSNTDSALVPTQRSLIFNELNKNLYKKFFLSKDELQACKDGYIYVHDMNARNLTMNCCLADIANIMRGGFEMGNIQYTEPKTLDVCFDVMGDIILNGSSSQYGGFTVPEIDKIIIPYAEKSFKKYKAEFYDVAKSVGCLKDNLEEKANEYAMSKIKRDMEQGYQGLEIKLNSVGSSRGDYPFVTFTFGLSDDVFGSMFSKTMLEVHRKGQGEDGKKRATLFPKLVFLYDKNLHGDKKKLEWLFDEAIMTCSQTMYPDILSLTGDGGNLTDIYKKYGVVTSPMGKCKLSPCKTNLTIA